MIKEETKFKTKVLKQLNSLPNCYFVKISDRVVRGIPDIFLCVNGHFIAIELKTNTGKTDALQAHTLRRIQSANGSAVVATPENWGLFFAMLSDLAGVVKK